MSAKDRLSRLESTIEAQKAFLHRIPDPDTRSRAETHLLELVEMREEELRRLKAIDATGASR